jgi:hypothetical protein
LLTGALGCPYFNSAPPFGSLGPFSALLYAGFLIEPLFFELGENPLFAKHLFQALESSFQLIVNNGNFHTIPPLHMGWPGLKKPAATARLEKLL